MYHVFAGGYFYPQGGVHDYLTTFNTMEECIEYLRNKHKNYDWYHITTPQMQEVRGGSISDLLEEV